MPDRLPPEHWLTRAAEARALAERMHDDEARRTMLRISIDYERLADRARARAPTQQSGSLDTRS